MKAEPIRPLRTAVAMVVCTVAVCVLTLWVELVMHAATLTFTYPPLNAFLILLVVLALYNPIVRRIVPGATLSGSEVLITYSVVSVGAGLVSTRYAMFLPALLAAPAYYASPGNDFQVFLDQTPSWLKIESASAASALFDGAGPGSAVPWEAWLVPVGAWTILMIVLGFVLCLVGILLSRRWIDDERLAFPLAQIPLEVSGYQHEGRPVPHIHGRLFLLGLLLAAGWRVLADMEYHFPELSGVEQLRGFDLIPSDIAPPWSAALPLSLTIVPAVVALAFLAPSDVIGSIWVFFVLRKLALVGVSALELQETLGLHTPTDFFAWQGVGAYVFMAVVLVGRGWGSFRREACPRARFSLIVALFVGSAIVILWSALSGMSVLAALVFWGLFLANSVVLARMIAEGGLMWLLGPIRPDRVVTHLMSAGMVPSWNRVSLAFHSLHTRVYHGLALPNLMQALKIGDEIHFDSRRMATWAMAGLGVVLVLSVPLSVALASDDGGLTLAPLIYGTWARQPFAETIQSDEAGPGLSNWPWAIAGFGAVVMSGLVAVRRTAHPWMPNPLGYLVALTVQSVWLNWIWFSIFVAWLLKTVCLRLFGQRGYLPMRRMLLGVFVGDVAGIGLWLVIDTILGVRGHWLFP